LPIRLPFTGLHGDSQINHYVICNILNKCELIEITCAMQYPHIGFIFTARRYDSAV